VRSSSNPGRAPGRDRDAAVLSRRRILWIKVRMAVLLFLLAAGLAGIVRRAWILQVRQGPVLRALAEDQYLRDVRLPARRGVILDRAGNELAVSAMVDSIFANPREVRDPAAAAGALAGVLGVDPEPLARRLAGRKHFVWVKRRVRPQEAAAVRALRIPGIAITPESERFYPNRELAGHVLGFVGADAVGLEGLELEMDEVLRGRGERVQGLADALGNVVFSDDLFDDGRGAGADVQLALDRTIQHIAEEELANTIRAFEAKAGSVVVADPRTGEIIAIANHPAFNPNEFSAFPQGDRRDRAVTDRFEPGSTLKVFTVAAALASGAVAPDDVFFCERGLWQLADYKIRDSHRDGWLNPAQVLARSSNIGAGKIGLATGKSKLFSYLRRFGFGQRTGVPLPGESSGSLRDFRRWYDVDLVTTAFGQGMTATTLQLTMAMAAVANEGQLMEPILVRRVIDSKGRTTRQWLPRVRRRVIPRSTARLLADMLTSVTEEGGTGLEAGLGDMLVAGKTGTAQKADFLSGGYTDLWVASFIGFVPADRPRLVISVVVDEPVINHTGGVVAAPAFRRIADRSLRYLGEMPSRVAVTVAPGTQSAPASGPASGR